MILSRKKTAIYFLAIVAVIFCSYISISELVAAQTTLSQATTGFNILPFYFVFTNLAARGIRDSFSASWLVQQGEPGQNTGVNCTFIGDSNADCCPKPSIQGAGSGGCTVSGSGTCTHQNPPVPYNLTQLSDSTPNYAALNNISCFVYYVPDSLANATYNISFYPVAFDVTAALGSLTVGRAVPLKVNIQNYGLLSDQYTVNFTSSSLISFSNPNTQTEYLQGNPNNETGSAQTDVTALAAFGSTTQINIHVNSTVYPLIGKQITINLSAGLASLPDFTIFGIIQIIILAAVILWAKK